MSRRSAGAVRLHDVAGERRAAGRPADGLASCERALAILERECGDGHPDVANVLLTLGEVHEDPGGYAEAERCYRRAVAIMRALPLDQKVLVRLRVQALVHLGGIERVHGRLDGAEAVLLDALALAETDLCADDLDVATACNALGMVYKYAGRFDEARERYDRALALLETAHGPDAPALASLFRNVGGLEHARGRHADGEPHARRSVAIRERALGPLALVGDVEVVVDVALHMLDVDVVEPRVGQHFEGLLFTPHRPEPHPALA